MMELFQPTRPSKDFSIWLHSDIFVYSTDILGFSFVTPCEFRHWYVGQDRACQWLSLKGKIELELSLWWSQPQHAPRPCECGIHSSCFHDSVLHSLLLDRLSSNTRAVGGMDGQHIQTRYRWGRRWRGAATPRRCLCFSQSWQIVQKLCSGNNFLTRPMVQIVSGCGVE